MLWILLLSRATEGHQRMSKMLAAAGGSNLVRACTLQSSITHFVCASNDSPYQLSYIPVTSPYTRVYDTMSSTNHGTVQNLQYHQPSNTIYMSARDYLVRYPSQLPTAAPRAVEPVSSYAAQLVSLSLDATDTYVFGGSQTGAIQRWTADLAVQSQFVAHSGSVRYLRCRPAAANRLVALVVGMVDGYYLSWLVDVDVAVFGSASSFSMSMVFRAQSVAISQIADDIVYISTSDYPRGAIRKVRFSWTDSSALASMLLTSPTSNNLEPIPGSALLISTEANRIYLIDLDTFTIVTDTIMTASGSSYTSRSVSHAGYGDGQFYHFVVGSSNGYS